MFRILFILIVVVSAIEIALFVLLGNALNVWYVLLGIVLTGLLGGVLAKQQGVGTLNRARVELSYGRVPTEEIFDGIAILIGAVLLFTPGFLTDTFGFILLIPQTRLPVKRYAQKLLKEKIKNGTIHVYRRY